MNERIKDLMTQAVNYACDNQKSMDTAMEKFAELIVRECAKIVNSLGQYEGQGDCSTAEYIKEHFGVE